jgi:hypothetical protein
MQTTNLDQKRLGMQTWCETQKTKLPGFIRSKSLHPARTAQACVA